MCVYEIIYDFCCFNFTEHFGSPVRTVSPMCVCLCDQKSGVCVNDQFSTA